MICMVPRPATVRDWAATWENWLFAYAKTKTQISAFVFATRIVQSLFFLNPKFQASSQLLWLYRPVCVGPGQKPRRPVFPQRGSSLNYNLSSIGFSFCWFKFVSYLYLQKSVFLVLVNCLQEACLGTVWLGWQTTLDVTLYTVFALFSAPAPISAPQGHFWNRCAQAQPYFRCETSKTL